jgi:prevent-host-death family protein
MKEVNALAMRNNLGKVLDELERDRRPILVCKGRRPRAVLITVEDFRARFLDAQAAEARQKLIESIGAVRARRSGGSDSLAVLRELRGELG